ncbi:MAG: hypothetical protein KJO31_08365 [Gammaproteobacteria bacterium]|nr:hypothetical protein [Gammaproteobacteria bacterium]
MAATAATASDEEVLGSAIIQNSSVYSAADLFSEYHPFLGKAVTKETATQIAEAIRERYRRDGYSRPGYRVANNGMTSGIVRIQLIEPSISDVRHSGKSGPHQQRLDALFDELSSERSLRPVDIRDLISQAKRLPGLDVNITTTPDENVPGGYVLEVDSDYQAINGSLTYTNRGTQQIGRNLVFGRIASNGLLGDDNILGMFLATAGNPNDYSSGGAYFRAPVGERGANALLQGSMSKIQVVSSGVLVDQDRERYIADLSRPLRSGKNRQLTLRGALEIDDLDVYHDGVLAREDRLRTIEVASTVSWRGSKRQHLLTAEAEVGLAVMGSRLDNFVNPDDGRREDFVIVRFHYVDLTPLTQRWNLRIDSYAQYSPHLLPSIRQFKVGGGRIGRGFDAAAVRGDRGLGAKAELRGTLPLAARWYDRVEAYGFYDIGGAWNRAGGGRESAASAGVGLAVRGNLLSGYLEVAQPLTHADADGEREPGLFVELTGQF